MVCNIVFLSFVGYYSEIDACLHIPYYSDSIQYIEGERKFIEVPVYGQKTTQSIVITLKGRVIYSFSSEELDGIKYFTKLKDFKEAEVAVVYRKKF